MKTRVLIYEDNHLLRESIAQLLNYSDAYVVSGSFANASLVVQQVKDLEPEIVLMDIDMPGGMNGIEAVRKILAFDQQVPVIMLTVFDDNTNVLDAINAGASGYLLKKHLSHRLLDSIQEVLSGGAPMSPNVARMVIDSMHKYPSVSANTWQLTSREKEILAILAQGTGYKGVASQFFISIDTVRTHVKNIYHKMQVHSQLEAVAKARDAGIV
jgi:DNA-binding NarL/FixJ family response regulator